MSNPPVAGVKEGDILAGKYRIDKVLGVGGMGVVVAAHHIHLDDRVAIKFLLPEALNSAEAVARFAREARAAVKIKGEHVARVTDVGTLETGSPYMVMEYLEGSDLSQWVEQRGALSFEQASEFVLQACEAIAEAHALGIVHRDLKPANLFVIRRPDASLSVKVLDFGISKSTMAGKSGSDMTRTAAMMGSPLYMSPEQIQSSKDVDGRTDIWALGVILYELVTATSPFEAETLAELVFQIMSREPPPLRNKRPDAPPGFEQVVLKCLDKDRGRRFQTVAELAVALLDFAPRRSKASVERISGILHAAGLAGTYVSPPSSNEDSLRPAGAATAASWGRTTTKGGTSRGLVLGLTALGLVVAASTAAVIVRLRAEPVPSPASPTASTDSPATTVAANTRPPAATTPVVASVPVPAAIVDPAGPSPSVEPALAEALPSQKPKSPVPTTPHGKPAAAVSAKVSMPAPPTAAPPPPPNPPATRPAGDDWGGRL